MALFSEEFAGWRDSDFDAFAPAKWRSNRFTPERTRVRLRLSAALESAVAAAGLSSEGLQLWSSRPEPALTNAHEVRSLTVAWTRVGAENVETAHIYAGVVIDQTGVTLRLRLPGEQQQAWQPLRATLAELAALTGMRVGLGASDVLPEALASSELAGDLLLERVMTRAEAIGGLLTVDELAAWSGVVIPMLAQLLGVTLQAAAPTEPPTVAGAVEQPGAEESVALPSAESAPAAQRDPPARRGYRPQWAPQSPTRAGAAEAVRPPIDRILPPTWHPEPIRRSDPPPPRRPEPPRQPPFRRPEPLPPSMRPGQHQPSFAPGRAFELGPSPQKAPTVSGVLAPGARVELLKGLFAGKSGTVAEVAGTHVQVLLGLMSVRVPTADLRVR